MGASMTDKDIYKTLQSRGIGVGGRTSIEHTGRIAMYGKNTLTISEVASFVLVRRKGKIQEEETKCRYTPAELGRIMLSSPPQHPCDKSSTLKFEATPAVAMVHVLFYGGFLPVCPDDLLGEWRVCFSRKHWYADNGLWVLDGEKAWTQYVDFLNARREFNRIASRVRSEMIKSSPVCSYCGLPITYFESGGRVFTDGAVDHIMPLCRGGKNHPDNYALSCKSCNSSKGCKLVSEWNPPSYFKNHRGHPRPPSLLNS